MFKREIKNYNLDIYVPNLISDLLGFTCIGLIAIITLLVASRWPAISKIIFAAFTVRVSIMLIGHYFFHLPDSTDDAIGFEAGAWDMAKNGFINTLKNFPGINSFFYSWMISIPYSLFGRSILMMQSIGLLFGLGTVFLGWMVAKKLWNEEVAIRIGWIMALFPSLVLYSVVTLREVYASFFLLVAFMGIINWARTQNNKSIVLATIGFIGASFFHSALIIGGIIFFMIVGLSGFKTLFKSMLRGKINIKNLTIVVISLFLLSTYFSNKVYIGYIGYFKTSISLEKIRSTIDVRMKGTASYSSWTKINSPNEIIYKIPVRAAYFLFSPFPWNVKNPIHLAGVFDGFLYLTLVYLIFCNRRVIWNDPALRIIFIILLFYILVWGIGISNFGAGIRHRAKFVIILILLAGPLIPKLILSKKKLIKYFK